jgi:symplekin
MCPRLVGFVMNILAKLITKQVWKQSKVWQGFVKCCQMTKPQSFPVLLQLPVTQLEAVFEIAPEIKPPLIAHIETMTPHQRAHFSKTVLTYLVSGAKVDDTTAPPKISTLKAKSSSKTSAPPTPTAEKADKSFDKTDKHTKSGEKRKRKSKKDEKDENTASKSSSRNSSRSNSPKLASPMTEKPKKTRRFTEKPSKNKDPDT